MYCLSPRPRHTVDYRCEPESVHKISAAYAVCSIVIAIVLWTILPRGPGFNEANFPTTLQILGALWNLFDPRANDYLAIYGFRRGATIFTHIGATLTSVSLSIAIGLASGIALGTIAGTHQRWSLTVLVWLLCYYGFPRLLELLFLTSLKVVGTQAGVILGSLAVTYMTAMPLRKALQDEKLRHTVECARLDTSSTLVIVLGVALPQALIYINTGLMQGIVAATGTVIFAEYIQSTTGLGYLLQIAFGNDPLVAQAFAVGIVIVAIILVWCGIGTLALRYASPALMRSAEWIARRGQPRHI